ncbi:MAG: clostripain-related cysteine peptidase [Elusimicrobia bacterium]|nr:clostripain-related cysteine peptidase [Elusimicrobiota bacterium]
MAGILFAAAAVLGASAWGQGIAVDFDQPNPSLKDLLETNGVHLRAPEQADWTVMVYVNAKNDLEYFGLKNVNQMEMIGSTDKVKFVVELGRMEGFDESDGDWTGSRRYLIRKDDDEDHVTSPILAEIPKSDMGDWRHLVEFTKWAKASFPAKRTMLIVWNHGSGWLKSLNVKGISYDDETGHNITTTQLKAALQEIGGVDVYASDACLMQMPEVAYEIRDQAAYIVGSEESEPKDGYTYDDFFKRIVAAGNPTPEQVGAFAVDSYVDHYRDRRIGSTQSLIKTSGFPEFVRLLDEWTAALMAQNDEVSIRMAKYEALSFFYPEHKDLGDFVRILDEKISDPDVRRKGAALLASMEGKLVVKSRTSMEQYQRATGLAIYLPQYNFADAYDELDFAKASHWAGFVRWCLLR